MHISSCSVQASISITKINTMIISCIDLVLPYSGTSSPTDLQKSHLVPRPPSHEYAFTGRSFSIRTSGEATRKKHTESDLVCRTITIGDFVDDCVVGARGLEDSQLFDSNIVLRIAASPKLTLRSSWYGVGIEYGGHALAAFIDMLPVD